MAFRPPLALAGYAVARCCTVAHCYTVARYYTVARCLAAALCLGATFGIAPAQVFVVGEKTAMADTKSDFAPTRVELPDRPITERGRRELVRNLEAEQGFAHRALPLGDTLILLANGHTNPSGDAYKEMLYKKGISAEPGDRVVISTLTVKADRIVFDLNGGPYLKHRFLRHIELNDIPLVPNDGAQVTGSRITLVFEGGIPDLTAPEVKALLEPILDFGVKTSREAYADTLPPVLKEAIAHHDILVGMNRRMVLAAAGAPEAKERELVPGSTDRHYEEWIYGRQPQTVRFVRIENDRVTQVKTAALGQPIAIRDKNEIGEVLDPADSREIALGDKRPEAVGDTGLTPAAPPSLRLPGEAAPANASNKVQYPVPQKEKPIPATPGSSADTSAPPFGGDLPGMQGGSPTMTPNMPSASDGGATPVPGSRH